MSDKIQVRRAKRADLAPIAGLVRVCHPGEAAPDEAQVMDWLFSKGLLVALQDDRLAGVIAWQVENLVAVTDVFCLQEGELLPEAGGALLQALEEEASTLMCEVNIVLAPGRLSPATQAVLEEQGYEAEDLSNLHRIWREVLDDLVQSVPELRVKWLRDRMVMVPI